MAIRFETELRLDKNFPWTEKSWISSTVNNYTKIDAAINEFGFSSKGITDDLYKAISEIAIQYPEDFAPFNEHRPPRPLAVSRMQETIVNWWNGIRVVEESSTLQMQQVPLCIFNAPPIPGSKTTYSEAKTVKETPSWKVEILGTGFGADVTIAIKHVSEFVASAGNRKLVFVPLKVRVIKSALYKQGVYQNSFLKTELAETEVTKANGIRTVNLDEWKELTSSTNLLDRFDTSGDMSGDIAKYTQHYELTDCFESKIGLKAFDLETTLSAKCIAEHTAEVTFELPAGRIYEVFKPSSVSGFIFQTLGKKTGACP